MKKLLVGFGLMFLGIPMVFASQVKGYLFYLEDCPYCQEVMRILKDISGIDIVVYNALENEELLSKVQEYFNVDITGYPVTIIGDKLYRGYNAYVTKREFVGAVLCYEKGYQSNFSSYLITGVGEYESNFELDKCIYQKMYEDIVFAGIKIGNTKDISIIFLSVLMGIFNAGNIIYVFLLMGMVILELKLNKRFEKYFIGGIVFEDIVQLVMIIANQDNILTNEIYLSDVGIVGMVSYYGICFLVMIFIQIWGIILGIYGINRLWKRRSIND